MSSRKVGIFAGSFDPIHEGHLQIAHEALSQCGLEKVFFLVEPRPRRKQGVKALEHRVRMVQLAIKNEPKFGSIILEQSQFTVSNTLPILQARFLGARLYLIMGDDVANHLAGWPHVAELADTELIVALRKKSATEVKRHLEAIKKIKTLSLHYTILSSSLSSESSSHIRAQLRACVVPPGLPKTVHDYIQANSLYASTGGS